MDVCMYKWTYGPKHVWTYVQMDGWTNNPCILLDIAVQKEDGEEEDEHEIHRVESQYNGTASNRIPPLTDP